MIKSGWLNGVPAIAEYIGIHPDTLRKRWMKKFDWPFVKIGGRWCVHPSTLDKFLEIATKRGDLEMPP